MYHRGDSGQKKTPISSGSAGIKADPNWSRHEIFPVSLTTKLATVPRKMPNAVQSCHVMTRAPRMLAASTYQRMLLQPLRRYLRAFSAAKIGIDAPLHPIPIPRSSRMTKSCSQAGKVCQRGMLRCIVIGSLTLRNSGPDRRQGAKDGRNKNAAAAAEELV